MEQEEKNQGKEKPHVWITISKDVVTVAREVLLLLLVLLLLIWPEIINGRLQDAGFTKADMMGLHWEKQVEAAAAQTGEARQRVEAVEQRIDSVRSGLEAISSRATDPEMKKEVERLTSVLDSSLQSMQGAELDLRKGQRIQERLLLKAPSAMGLDDAAGSTGSWAIVISGDRKLDEARFEMDRARKLGYNATSLFNQGKWIRTIIEYPDREAAQDALQGVRERVRQTAYVIDLSTWCRDYRKNPRTGIYECQ